MAKTVLDVLDDHWPTLTEQADDEIDEAMSVSMAEVGYVETANLAIRYCRCGLRIDGFDELMLHLKDVFQQEMDRIAERLRSAS